MPVQTIVFPVQIRKIVLHVKIIITYIKTIAILAIYFVYLAKTNVQIAIRLQDIFSLKETAQFAHKDVKYVVTPILAQNAIIYMF